MNLLVNLSDRSLVVIDHNLAFSGEVSSDLAELHVGYPAWRALDARRAFTDQVRSEMLDACATLVNVTDILPIEWLEDEEEFLDNALSALGRVASHKFWDQIP